MNNYTIDAQKLTKLLSKKASVIVQGDKEYDEKRKQIGWWRNSEEEALKKISPSLICIPYNDQDVSTIVKFATTNGYKVVPRSGGHQISGHSSGEKREKTIQIDMRNFVEVHIEQSEILDDENNTKSRRVTVGTGVRLGELGRILNGYDLHIPMGVCSNVCAGGHYQSSAFGVWSRSLGLGIDYITHIKICLASGEIVTVHADNEEHRSLFWALRGGSPGAFGVVLEYQFNAILVNSFEHAYLGRFYWENDKSTFDKVFNTLKKIKEHPAYKCLKDFTIYIGCFPDLYNPYLGSSPVKKKHTINALLGWTGIDSGSIYNPIPSEFLGTEPLGTSFYDVLIKPLQQIPNLMVDESLELHYEEDPKNNINYLACLCMGGSDIVGSLDQIRKDRQGLLPPNKAEDNAKYTETTEENAKLGGVDVEMEVCRYTTISNWTSYGEGFDEGKFLSKLSERVAILEETPDVWALVQVFTQELEPDESSAFPTRGDNFGYDIWIVWRPVLGASVAEAAMNWANETDKILRESIGQAVFCQTWCSKEETDMNNISQRRIYYPKDDQYELLQIIKGKYDATNMFSTKFTVKPIAKDAVIPNIPKPINQNLYAKPLDKNTKQFSFFAGRNYNVLIGRMQSHAFGKANEPYLTWINDDGTTQPAITFGQFYDDVAAYASWLKIVKKVEKGDRLILSYLPGPDFIKVFMACIFIGAIPVPVYPAIRDKNYMERFNHIVQACTPKYILVDKDVFAYKITSYLHAIKGSNGPSWIVVKPYPLDKLIEPEVIDEDDIALIQFTSGTTGLPKGAVLTHRNLLAQFKLIQDELDFHEDGVGLMWVPPYHDLGLMGSLLVNLMGGNHLYMMSPMSLMKNPAIWFSSIAKFKATHTGAPNFAYSMYLDKITDEEFASWDLSSLQMMMSAGEPVEQEVMDLLLDKLHRFCKVDKKVYCPSYGLAENAVCITMGGKRVLRVDRKQLMQEKLTISPEGMQITSCGKVISNVPVAIVKEEVEIGNDKIGEIWISGPSLATHYINDGEDDLNKRLPSRHGRWFRTGDIGFVNDGDLFVIGRAGDTIKVEGQVIFPNIIESVINMSVKGLRKGSTTVYFNELSKVLSVAIEMPRNKKVDLMLETAKNINQCILDLFGVYITDVHFLSQKSALKTSSGKLQRVQTGAAISTGKTVPMASCNISTNGQVTVNKHSKKILSSLFKTRGLKRSKQEQ